MKAERLSRNMAALERLRFIDAMLDYYGELNRTYLMDFFGISQAQASIDLKSYEDKAPHNFRYNSRAKKYQRMDSFQRLFP